MNLLVAASGETACKSALVKIGVHHPVRRGFVGRRWCLWERVLLGGDVQRPALKLARMRGQDHTQMDQDQEGDRW